MENPATTAPIAAAPTGDTPNQSPPANRTDWNDAIWDLYSGQTAETEAQWEERASGRLSGTTPGLPLAGYTGTYDNPILGEVTVTESEGGLVLKTTNVELSMTHWHLDTFLVEYRPWTLREFAEFRVGPDATVTAMSLFGETLTRVASED